MSKKKHCKTSVILAFSVSLDNKRSAIPFFAMIEISSGSVKDAAALARAVSERPSKLSAVNKGPFLTPATEGLQSSSRENDLDP